VVGLVIALRIVRDVVLPGALRDVQLQLTHPFVSG
jgi:hypothetical protein